MLKKTHNVPSGWVRIKEIEEKKRGIQSNVSEKSGAQAVLNDGSRDGGVDRRRKR